MKRRQQWHIALIAVCMTLVCAGCSLDVEAFLRPPKAQGEQQAIQQALETYIRDSRQSGTGTRYTLRYPTEGEHTSAFVVCDGTGAPIEEGRAENAAMAVAFYSISSAPDDTHVNLLRRDRDEWVSVGDTDGFGTEILQVAFGDLDGDGMRELVTGWSTYDSREHQLVIFSVDGGLTRLSADRLYTKMTIGDLTADGQDDLILMRIGAGNEVTAAAETLRPDGLTPLGSVRLDGYIQQFGDMTLCRLAEGVHGLYVDAVRSAGTTVTELIYYDDTGLHAPFYDPTSNTTEVTARASGLAARDIDGDALIEIPLGRRLPGYDDAAASVSYSYLTTWMSWDYETCRWSERLYAVVNLADGYLVALDAAQSERVGTRYDADTRLLTLFDEGEHAWLCLRTGGEDEDGYVRLFEPDGDYPGCTAWFDPARLDTETVRYMVSRLTA